MLLTIPKSGKASNASKKQAQYDALSTQFFNKQETQKQKVAKQQWKLKLKQANQSVLPF